MKTIKSDTEEFAAEVVSHLRQQRKVISDLPKIEKLLTKLSRRSGSTTAVVVSSVNLTSNERQEIERLTTRLAGTTISWSFVVQPSLLGGLRITVGDWLIDTSLEHQLELLVQNLVA